MKEIIDDLKNTFWTEERVIEYSQIASEHRFRFSKRERFAEQAYQLKGFNLFQGKRGKRLNGILEKDEKKLSLKTRIYDYLYYGNSSKKTSTVFEFYCPSFHLSRVQIKPKSSFAKIKSFFGAGKPYFQDLKSFNQLYEIQTENPDNLTFELNEDFLNLLAQQKGVWTEGEGNYLLFYFKNKTIPLGELMEFYDYFLALFERLRFSQSNEEYV